MRFWRSATNRYPVRGPDGISVRVGADAEYRAAQRGRSFPRRTGLRGRTLARVGGLVRRAALGTADFAGLRGVLDTISLSGNSSGRSRKITMTFPMCCTGAAPVAPQISPSSSSRASRSLPITRILISSCESRARPTSASTDAVSPALPISTTGLSAWARAFRIWRWAGASVLAVCRFSTTPILFR